MRIAEPSGSLPAESDEAYFLSADGDNAKVRDGLVDVKVLRDVNPAGLEQGAPLMKAAGACIVGTILGKLGKDRLTVSDRGLRHGLIAERFGQS